MSNEIYFSETDAAAIYDQIIASLEQSVGQPLYPGDERRIFGEALVAVFVSLYNTINDAARQRLLRYARGTVLDAIGERVGASRAPALPAKTSLRFAVASPLSSNILIPKGTKVATADESAYFATDETAVLQAGTSYVDVPASSIEGGSRYNGYAPGSISTLVDLIPYISTVENTVMTYGGDDGEPYTEEGDAKFRERIRLAPSRFSVAGPEGAYRYFALSADPRIADVHISSPEPGVVRLVPILVGGEIPPADILSKVEQAVAAPDVRPLTDHVIVQAPEQVQFDIELKYYTTAEDESRAIQTIEGEGGAIDRYIAWQSGALGRDINPDQLRKYILAPSWKDGLVGAIRVEIVKPQFTEIDDDEVAKFSGNLTLTHEVIDS